MAETPSPAVPSRGFVVAGCGYAGARVAARLAKQGPVTGITRVPRARKFEAPFGFDMLTWDFDSDRAGRLPQSKTAQFDVIYLVPPPASGTADPRIQRFLDALPAAPARCVYISTTGVYGDAGGGTVNEDTPPAPVTDRARRRLSAEVDASRLVRVARCRVGDPARARNLWPRPAARRSPASRRTGARGVRSRSGQPDPRGRPGRCRSRRAPETAGAQSHLQRRRWGPHVEHGLPVARRAVRGSALRRRSCRSPN